MTDDAPTPVTFAASAGYAPQRWSAEKPAAAGWWWVDGVLNYPPRRVVKVGQICDEWCVLLDARWIPVTLVNGLRWAGPLPEPLDAPDAETGHID